MDNYFVPLMNHDKDILRNHNKILTTFEAKGQPKMTVGRMRVKGISTLSPM